MKSKTAFLITLALFLFCCQVSAAIEALIPSSELPGSPNRSAITTKVMKLYDTSRNRMIPIEYYVSTKLQGKGYKLPVIIINHGYTVKNTEYSFLAMALAAQGYFVVSIQHDLKTDPMVPQTGNLYERRKPSWDRGVANILFVIKSLSKVAPHLNLTKVTLIGHSNGGDMVMLFTHEYPQLVRQAISLDSLRMPFPRSGKIPILSLRANDTKADPGVLPPLKDDKKLNITLIYLKDAKHIDLCDRGSDGIRKEVNQVILKFVQPNQ